MPLKPPGAPRAARRRRSCPAPGGPAGPRPPLRPFPRRRGRVEHRRQRVDVHVDELGAVLGQVPGSGHHQGHDVAGEPHVLLGQQPVRRLARGVGPHTPCAHGRQDDADQAVHARQDDADQAVHARLVGAAAEALQRAGQNAEAGRHRLRDDPAARHRSRPAS
ncbi:MAG TPA: hypothetical protein VFQ68_00190 [Streptosporangiaceae bacterium]|nr:hypothetical protein [Streptosporangiaceae bacterium]